MDPSLEQAYKEARYVVIYEQQELLVKVAKHYLWLDDLLISKGVKTAAFITAFNPQSQLLDELSNIQNQQKLKDKIEKQGCQYLTGFSSDENGEWPIESCFLLLGVKQGYIDQLAHCFNQAAYLWITIGLPVELKFLTGSVQAQ